MKKIKVLFFLEGIYNGGTEIAVINLISKLYKNYDIYYSYTDKLSDKEVVKLFDKYAKYININDNNYFDNIIFATSANNAIQTILRNIKYNKMYFWFHYFWEDQTIFLNYCSNNNLLDKIIVVSKYCEKELIKLGYTNIIVINNILDKDKIIRLSNEKNIKKLSKLTFVVVARIAPVKGYEKLISMIKSFKRYNLDFTFNIIGKANEYESEYSKNIITKLKNFDEVNMLGHLENPYCYMKNADYVVVLSDRETWSLVINEAKILKVPCISTNFDAAYEQIENNYNGIILSDCNFDEKFILDLVNNKDRFKNNLNNYNYNDKEILDKWENILNEKY